MRNIKQLQKIFKGKKILITGHTGFKGTWLTSIFDLLGAKILGISKDYPNKFFYKKNFKNLKEKIIDLSNYNLTNKILNNFRPDFVFHLAAQAIVSKSYTHPLETWNSNLISFLNILESIRNTKKNIIAIMITSDKCYLNVEKKRGYKENERMGGDENYSASKASCEILLRSYFNSYFKKNSKIKIASARAGNVIGGGDWSKNRLIPDIIRSINTNKILNVRSLESTRPWQHVLEPLSGYLNLAVNLNKNKKINGQSFNFGPKTRNYTVEEVLNKFKNSYKNLRWKKINKEQFKESKLLNLNCSKIKKMTNWEPKLNFHQTMHKTIEWYNLYNMGQNITNQQIKEYFNEK